MPDDLKPNVVSDTIAELAEPEKVPPERVMARLIDWRDRVHTLYGDIEAALGDAYTIDRSGKHVSQEKLIQLARLSRDQVPRVDILRVEQSGGTLRALLQPRALWAVGANGVLELQLFDAHGARCGIYRVIDMSRTLVPPARWSRMPFASPSDEGPFSGEILRKSLEE